MSASPDPLLAAGAAGTHQVYRWSGTPYEIGRQHGEALRQEIVAEVQPALDESARRHGLPRDRVAATARSAWTPLFERLAPRALEEIRGLAEGAELDLDTMFFAALHHGTYTRLPAACTSFVSSGTASADGHVLIGQNKDTMAPLTRYRIMELTYEDGACAVLLNYPGWVANVGMTSKGIAFCANSLYGQVPGEPSAPTSLLRRLLLERDSVDEVLGCIEGLSLDNGCTLMADRTGRAVCLEAVAGEVQWFDVSARAFAHANSICARRLKHYEVPYSPSSPGREANLQRLLDENAGAITPAAAQGFLADHTDFPLSVCRHKSDRDPAWTTASFVADVTAGDIHIAIGHPCTGEFRAYGCRS